MASFGENYRGGRDDIPCPVCGKHRDSQALLVKCEVFQKHFNSCIDIRNIYTDNIDKETVETLEAAMIIRNNYILKRSELTLLKL